MESNDGLANCRRNSHHGLHTHPLLSPFEELAPVSVNAHLGRIFLYDILWDGNNRQRYEFRRERMRERRKNV